MCNNDATGKDLGLTDKNHACTCGSAGHADTASPVSENAIGEHYLVEGMTCGHCVASVTEEVSAIKGVDSVSVDLNAGGVSRVTVVSSEPVDADSIRAAVTEAGYSLVSK